ncbi:FAD-dependent oxidoreductase [Caballeronia sp. dw_19]|uniref:NAD(P)/FAD-dependent oxidoreductase n=1 Tax=Caballeronia sp. dw_19 TaxID=2719791 RepID=UPI001BD21987|nr:FAD-dependent oxidoreductase [Caballeronia sp. dw_19]
MTVNLPQSVVIVGAGHAGGRAAINLRQLGFAGRITVLGDEMHPPYERPPLSKEVLTGIAPAQSTHLVASGEWDALDVKLALGDAVVEVDRGRGAVRLASSEVVPYDALILATGARARAFPGKVDAGAPVHTLRTLADAAALAPRLLRDARVAVLGAGFIGLEVASSAVQLGARVTVIEAAERPLMRLLPTGFAEWITSLHAGNGVDLRFDTRVTRLRANGIEMEHGAGVAADVIVVGIGAQPNDELASQAGLAVENGVLVDGECRTHDPHIFAIGDVARLRATHTQATSRIESWRKAEDDAQTVAAVLCGAQTRPRDVPWFWTDQFGRNIQLAGEPSDRYASVLRGNPGQGSFVIYYLEGNALRGVIGVDCGRDVRAAQKLIQNCADIDPAALPTPKVKAAKAESRPA